MKYILIAVAILFNVASSFAEDRSSGCGLGKMIAPRKSLVSTSTAATTDAVSFPTQPSAMTSGTSGCAPHGVMMEAYRKEHFISTNIASIRFESAIGQGEHLAALGQFFGCTGSSQGKFAQTMKSHYAQIFMASENAKSINVLIQDTLSQDGVCLI